MRQLVPVEGDGCNRVVGLTSEVVLPREDLDDVLSAVDLRLGEVVGMLELDIPFCDGSFRRKPADAGDYREPLAAVRGNLQEKGGCT